jgi:hypothetical protein|tara:strand:- start:369 stop:608 length:240 start_codon:yes stop_codon:yes gene_type:complete
MKANRKFNEEHWRLKRHLRSMQAELLNCYAINHKFSYGRNPHYFREQIKITTQKLKSYCDKYPNDTELGREIRKLRYKQ